MSFSRGPHTFTVTAKLFSKNRERLVDVLRTKSKPRSVILLKGGEETLRNYSDSVINVFRQVNYLRKLFILSTCCMV